MSRFQIRTPLRPALLLALGLATLASASPLPGIAVLPLEAKQITRDEADILTDALANEIYRTGQVRVVERAQLEKILKEQSLQTSGVCSANECAVEIGRILGLDRVVVGTAGKLGAAFVISARIVDVGGGEILGSTSRHATGRIEDMLGKLIPVVAHDLYSPAPPPEVEPVPLPAPQTSPADSSVPPPVAKARRTPPAKPPLDRIARNSRFPWTIGYSLGIVNAYKTSHGGISGGHASTPRFDFALLHSSPSLPSHTSLGTALGIAGQIGGTGPLVSLSAVARRDFPTASHLLFFMQPRFALHFIGPNPTIGLTGEFGAGYSVGERADFESGLSWTAAPVAGHVSLAAAAPSIRLGLRTFFAELPRGSRAKSARQAK